MAKFKKIIHAAQSKRSSDNIKNLHTRQDAARQSNTQTTKQSSNQKYGIIHGMKKNAESAVLAALAIAGGNGEA